MELKLKEEKIRRYYKKKSYIVNNFKFTINFISFYGHLEGVESHDRTWMALILKYKKTPTTEQKDTIKSWFENRLELYFHLKTEVLIV